MKKFLKRSVWGLLTVFFAFCLAISVVAASIAQTYRRTINTELGLRGTEPVKREDGAENTVDTNYYPSNYQNEDGTYNNRALFEHNRELAREVQQGGTTILWNKDANGTRGIPLSTGAKVSLFGRASADYAYSGTGSAQAYGKNMPTLRSSLESEEFGGLDINDTLWNFYTEGAGAQYEDTLNKAVNEVPWDKVSSDCSSSFSEYGDAAILVIARRSGEDSDFYMRNADTVDGDYLSLHRNEQAALENLITLKQSGTFKRIILLLNTPTGVNFKCLKSYMDDINCCLWVGQSGYEGLNAVAQILSGKASPSGHLADLFAYDYQSAPATVNLNLDGTKYTNWSDFQLDFSYQASYIVYVENIYVGYKYYETRYEDSVLGQGNAVSEAGKKQSAGNWTYGEEVAFPFGYGASYTEFKYSNFDVKVNSKGDYDVQLTVNNVGGEAGRDAVQIYIQKPYTDYDKEKGLEQSAVNLCGYFKTGEIPAGGHEDVKITVRKDAFKTFDDSDAIAENNTYILEQGTYYITAAQDSHEAVNNILAAKGCSPAKNSAMDANGNAQLVETFSFANADRTTFSKSSTGYPVVSQFANADLNKYMGKDTVTYLSRSDWSGTYPTQVQQLSATRRLAADLANEHPFSEAEDAVMPLYEQDNGFKLIDMRGLTYNDELWDLLLNEMSLLDQSTLCATAYHGTAEIISIAKPDDTTTNGAMGVIGARGKYKNDMKGEYGMSFPSSTLLAATFDDDLAKRVGTGIGEDMLHTDISGLYGPSINLHRTAYGGRNFEYYSEDGFLSGMIAAQETIGIEGTGNYVTIKHFALNDQEVTRGGVAMWANEQTIRETYLIAFEFPVELGGARSAMSSFTRIGTWWSGAHKGLMTEVLRNEWGFKGYIVSDSPYRQYMGLVDGALYGNDCILYSLDARAYVSAAENSPTVAQALRESCHRILYVIANSSAMNGVDANMEFVPVTQWWEKMAMGIEIGFGILTGLSLGVFVASLIVNRKKPQNDKN